MCKGGMCDVTVLEPKSGCKMANKLDFYSPITVKWQNKRDITDEIY